MNSKQRRKAYRAMPKPGEHFSYRGWSGTIRHAVSDGPVRMPVYGEERGNVINVHRVKAHLWLEEDVDYPTGGVIHPLVSRIVWVRKVPLCK